MTKLTESEVKCTLAACMDQVEIGSEYEELPLHQTIAPPFFVSEERLYDLVLGYDNLISPWSSLLYEENEAMIISASTVTAVFGTDNHPVPVRRVNLSTPMEKDDLLTLREWIKERTEDVCGEDSTKNWVLGELHISEGGHDLTVLEGPLAISSLVLFVKRGSKWRAENIFDWSNV